MRRSHLYTIFNKNISVIKYKYIYNDDKYKTCKNKINKKVLKHKKIFSVYHEDYVPVYKINNQIYFLFN